MKQKKPVVNEKVHLNKGFANINYFMKINEDNPESIFFLLALKYGRRQQLWI